MKTINNFNFRDKRAIIRVDFNVPLDNNFKITDNTRIQAVKPTIDKILQDGGSAILMSHLGRPKGKEAKYSLSHIVDEVSKVLGVKVRFIDDCIGSSVESVINKLKPGEVVLLENLRFYEEETKGEVQFSEQLSRLGDIYVNDAFGTAHRAHASTTIIAQFFPNKKCFGYLMSKEINAIDKVLKSNNRPVTAILGGSKVSSKITIIENLLNIVDYLIIGGGMAYTFLKAQGGNVGDSICEDDKQDLALDIIQKAQENNVELCFPIDVVIADDFSNTANTKIAIANNIPKLWQGLDAGVKTLESYKNIILKSKTILWNGPVGVFEMSKFAKGTIAVGNFVTEATKNGAFSLVGGGDSVAAVKQFGFEDKVSYVSTGGGAMLESLENSRLVGVQAILD